jgi:hypothetical protein
MTRDDIIRMAKEAGFTDGELAWHDHMLERFAALVSDAEAKRMHDEGMVTVGHMREKIEKAIAAERERGQVWFDAVTAQHKQEVLAEREACAKVCDDLPEEQMWLDHLLFVGSRSCAEAIRART